MAKMEDYQKQYYEFEKKFKEIKKEYEENKDAKISRNSLQKLASEYRKHYGACMIFMEYGTEIFDCGEKEHGYKILQIGLNTFKDTYEDTGLYLRFVQYFMENDEVEKATEYLMKICNNVPNYDESIEWSGMSAVWEKYKYLVEGKVPLPVSQQEPAIKSPEECSKKITEILKLEPNDLLISLSEHLDEMSDYGEEMVYLNKWEKVFYDVDSMLSEIGSGGVDCWLHSYGHRYAQTKKALQTVEADMALDFLAEIEKRFPKGKVPKSYDKLEAILDDMIDNDEDFEEEETAFYYNAGVEGELVDCLYRFVMENKKKFR